MDGTYYFAPNEEVLENILEILNIKSWQKSDFFLWHIRIPYFKCFIAVFQTRISENSLLIIFQ